jgi:hypothetical protein
MDQTSNPLSKVYVIWLETLIMLRILDRLGLIPTSTYRFIQGKNTERYRRQFSLEKR